MSDRHPHAAALDRIGKSTVLAFYRITPRTWEKWRARGIPSMHWSSLDLLARQEGKPEPRLDLARFSNHNEQERANA